ncbi:hypothetical protein [Plantibacter flavus]|nr:hypothetical protein [Plantibacter flavus]
MSDASGGRIVEHFPIVPPPVPTWRVDPGGSAGWGFVDPLAPPRRVVDEAAEGCVASTDRPGATPLPTGPMIAPRPMPVEVLVDRRPPPDFPRWLREPVERVTVPIGRSVLRFGRSRFANSPAMFLLVFMALGTAIFIATR